MALVSVYGFPVPIANQLQYCLQAFVCGSGALSLCELFQDNDSLIAVLSDSSALASRLVLSCNGGGVEAELLFHSDCMELVSAKGFVFC